MRASNVFNCIIIKLLSVQFFLKKMLYNILFDFETMVFEVNFDNITEQNSSSKYSKT